MSKGDSSGAQGSIGTTWLFHGSLLTYVLSFLLLTQVMKLPGLAWAPGVRIERDGEYTGAQLQVATRAEVRPRIPLVTGDDILLAANLTMLCAAYLALLQLLRAGKLGRGHQRLLAGGVLVSLIAMLLLPALLSNDVFSYILQGRIAQVWQGNPAREAPLLYAHDLTFAWTDQRWSSVPAVYGPAWLYISMAVTWLAERLGGALATYLLAYKVLAAALHLASAWLIWRILAMLAPQRRSCGTFLYGGSPLALIELAGSGHNDSALIFFLLAGILLHLHGHRRLALSAFVCAMLVKWTGGAAVVFYVALLIRTEHGRARFRSALTCAAIIGLVAAVGFVRFWSAESALSLGQVPSQTNLSNSLAAFIGETFFLRSLPSPERVLVIGSVFKSYAVVIGNVITVWATIALIPFVRDGATALQACAWLLFVYCALGTGWFWPWYVTWFLALAALLDWRVSGRVAVVFACSALAVYPFKFLPWRGLIAIAPALLMAGVLVWRTRLAGLATRADSSAR